MGEGGGGGCGGVGLVGEIHGGDEAVVEGEDVEDFGVGEEVALEAFDSLVDADAEFVGGFFGDGEGFDVGIELGPLAGPVGADFFFAGDLAALGGFGPAYVWGHEG